MKSNLKLFKKGIFALIIINFFLFGFSSILQSCSEDDSTIQNKEFDKKIEISLSKISNIKLFNKKSTLSKGENLNNIFILSNQLNNTLNNEVSNQINTFDDLIHISNENDLILSERVYKDTYIVDDFVIDEELVKEALDPAVTEAKKIINSNGVSNEEIKQLLIETGTTEEHLVPIIMLFNSVNNQNVANLNNSYNLFINNSYAQGFNLTKATDCAIAAVGLNLFDIARNISETSFNAALKAALRGIGTKFLGSIRYSNYSC